MSRKTIQLIIDIQNVRALLDLICCASQDKKVSEYCDIGRFLIDKTIEDLKKNEDETT